MWNIKNCTYNKVFLVKNLLRRNADARLNKTTEQPKM